MLWTFCPNTNVFKWLWNGRMVSTGTAVWGLPIDCWRLEVQLHWRFSCRSWFAFDWRETYECKPNRVSRLCGSRQPGSLEHLADKRGNVELDMLKHWKAEQLTENWRDAVTSSSARHLPSGSVLDRLKTPRTCLLFLRHYKVKLQKNSCKLQVVVWWVPQNVPGFRLSCGFDDERYAYQVT